MAWADIDANGVWSVPQQEREKGVGGALKLPTPALDVVQGLPRVGPYVLVPRPHARTLKQFRKDTGVHG
jgi:hypothetical protein